MKSFKTTFGGILLATGQILVQINDPEWLNAIGAAMVAIGGLFLGVAARDNNVNDVDAGVEH